MPAHLKIQCHRQGIAPPNRAHSTDAGMDLTAYAYENRGNSVFLFDTGISVQVSEGYYVEVVPRSSIIKTDFVMANSVGVIDPGYRGRIFVPFRYIGVQDSERAAQALLDQRIAQLLVRRLETCIIEVVETLNETERGVGGFGSTG